MKVSKLIAFIAIALVSFSALATNVAKGIYSNNEEGVKQCLADLSAGTAVGYIPTLHNPIVSKKFEIKKIGTGGACLTKARVTGDDGKGMQVATVSVAEGFGVGELKKNGVVIESRMETCSNLYENILFPKVKVAERPPETTPAPEPAAQPSVVQNTTVIVVVQPAQPTATVTAPATTTAVESCGDGCYLGFSLEKAVPRTDKRCVIAFRNDKEEYRFVRFGVMKDDKILHGAKVDNVEAEWNRSYDLVPIGKNNNGRDQAVKMPNATCVKVLEVIQIPGILDRVGPRLGLTKTCRPVRPV